MWRQEAKDKRGTLKRRSRERLIMVMARIMIMRRMMRRVPRMMRMMRGRRMNTKMRMVRRRMMRRIPLTMEKVDNAEAMSWKF